MNLSIAQDFEGKEYLHNNIKEFFKEFIIDKFKGYATIVYNAKGSIVILF